MSKTQPNHHRKEPPNNGLETYLPLTSREFFCASCKSKCTLTLSYGEVGHRTGCEHRSDSLPRGGRYLDGERDD